MRKSFEERFWDKVNEDGPLPDWNPTLGPCWLWTAYIHPDGYGWFGLGGGRTKAAHSVAYHMAVGELPEGLQLDHLCRVRHCVNPAHLEAVTRSVNIQRGVAAGTFGKGNRKKTSCGNGHSYSGTNLYINPTNGWRYCKTCRLERDRLHATERRLSCG